MTIGQDELSKIVTKPTDDSIMQYILKNIQIGEGIKKTNGYVSRPGVDLD